jgi:hypothetical protein
MRFGVIAPDAGIVTCSTPCATDQLACNLGK